MAVTLKPMAVSIPPVIPATRSPTATRMGAVRWIVSCATRRTSPGLDLQSKMLVLDQSKRTISLRERLMSVPKRCSQTLKRQFRTRAWIGVATGLALLFLAALALTGCAEPAAIAAVEPTATLYPPPPTDIPPPPPGPTPAALDFPLAAPRQIEKEPVNDQTCVDCHTDEETLKAVAENEEGDEETLSEGEG